MMPACLIRPQGFSLSLVVLDDDHMPEFPNGAVLLVVVLNLAPIARARDAEAVLKQSTFTEVSPFRYCGAQNVSAEKILC